MMQFLGKFSKRIGLGTSTMKFAAPTVNVKRHINTLYGSNSTISIKAQSSKKYTSSCNQIVRKMGTLSSQTKPSLPFSKPSLLNYTQKAHYNQKFENVLDPLIQPQMEKIQNNLLITQWLNPNSSLPLHDQLARLAPEMIEFVMGFSDFNIYFLRYVQTYTTFFQDIINKHTIEDRTHAKLFTRDWRLLDIDSYVEWDLADYMSWTLSPSISSKMKAEVMKLYDLVLHHPHPLVRYSIMEVIEGAGLIFFTKTAPLADKLQNQTGYEYKYFGTHHLALEDGGIGIPETSKEDSDEIEKEKEIELQQLDEMYGRYSKQELQRTVSHVVEETSKIFQTTFDSWYSTANMFHKEKQEFYHTRFKEDAKGYQNSTFKDDTTKHPHSFFYPSESMVDIKENNSDYIDLSSQIHEKLNDFDSKQEAILPFALIDLLGISFICGSDSRNSNSEDQDARLCHDLSQTIGKMGHALIHDYRKLEWGNDFSNNISSLLRYKFFSPRSDLHRTNFSKWFKSMLKEKDLAVRAVYLKITIDAYKYLLHGIYDHIHSDIKNIDLHLINGKWFYYFNKNFSSQINALKNDLSTEQQEKILIFRDSLVKNIKNEIKATKPEKLVLSPEEETSSTPTLTM